MKQKRVLMIAQSFYEFDPRILRQASVLVKNNYCVDIICLNHNNSPKIEKIGGVNVYRVMNKFEQDQVILYIINSFIFLLKAFLKSLTFFPKKRPDVVQIHNMPDYLVFSAMFYKILGTPVILDIHDLTVELFKEKWGEKKFKRLKPLLTLSERLSVKFANKVITVSDQCGEKLIDRGLPKDKLTIVMNVPDLENFEYDKDRKFEKLVNGLHLVYHGTIAERYGIHNIIKVLPLLIDKLPKMVFHLIGNIESEYGIYIKKLVSDLSLENNVHFEKPILNNKISEKLKSIDIGIAIADETEYSNFGIPTKVFEYTSVGLPVIVTDLKAIRSIYRESSIVLVDPGNSKYIADEIVRMAFNPEFRRTLSMHANEDLEKISYSIMSSRYLNLIKSISQNKPK